MMSEITPPVFALGYGLGGNIGVAIK